MRKVLSLLICVAMLCSLVVITAQADGGPQLQIANVTAIPGASVTVNFNVTNNTGVAAWRFDMTDDGLGIFSEEAVDAGELAFADATGQTLQDGNLKNGILVWYGPTDFTGSSMGQLTFKIPDDATTGDYLITIIPGTDDKQAVNAAGADVALAGTTFTVTVVDKVITGVNVAIDAGISIGVHVQATDIEGVSITAVDRKNKQYQTVTDYEEDEDTGDYIFYLNVNPWAMDRDFNVDFTTAFTFEGESLDMAQMPSTAKTTGILSYCEALLATSPSEELTQLIADLLAFGQAAQTYEEVAVMELPEGLTPTAITTWEDEEFNTYESFGDFCSNLYGEDLTAKKVSSKVSFDKATIKFGSKFVVVFDFDFASVTAASVRVKVNGTAYPLTESKFEYAFSPAEVQGVEFDLYASTTTNNNNFAWINNYGPATYAAYLYDNAEDGDGSEEILTLLEAFYNYGVSAGAYAESLSE